LIALIDGDTIVYRVGFASDSDDLSVAIHRCDSMLDGILEATQRQRFHLYLTDSENNFRRTIWPLYHANRKAEKPRWYNEIKEYLYTEWKAELAEGQEADDALGIAQTKDTIICSIDKDLKQIPGEHYNFVTQEFTKVTKEEGIRWFYKQLMMGDTVDNIQGIPGIGKVKAENFLSYFEQSGNQPYAERLYSGVRNLYHNKFEEMNLTTQEIDDIILRNARLLYIRKRKDELWNPPTPSATLPSESTPVLGVDSIQFTELTSMDLPNGSQLSGPLTEENSTDSAIL
jgi:5'-3' exonuclease